MKKAFIFQKALFYLIDGFNFDGKMVRNVGYFLPVNIRSLTKYTFGCNSPIVANGGSSPTTLKIIKKCSKISFGLFSSKTLWNWILDYSVFRKVPLENSLPERAEVQNYVHPPFRPHLWWPQMERPDQDFPICELYNPTSRCHNFGLVPKSSWDLYLKSIKKFYLIFQHTHKMEFNESERSKLRSKKKTSLKN